MGVARTPIGAFLGSLSSFSATKLGSIAIECNTANLFVFHCFIFALGNSVNAFVLLLIIDNVQVLLKGQMLIQLLSRKSSLGMF